MSRSRNGLIVLPGLLLVGATACVRSAPTPKVEQPPAQEADATREGTAAMSELLFETEVTPATATVGAPVTLNYRVSRADGTAAALTESHTKRSHLIVVRDDLSGFQHVHPAESTPGTFTIDLSFPAAGNYVLFADATPEAGSTQVHRFELEVTGPESPREALTVSSRTVQADGFDLALNFEPGALPVGSALLGFSISRPGAPVVLQPYLGALGHLVVISEDTTEFLHSHPDAASSSAGNGTASFHTSIPHAGRYRAWLQFQTDRGVHTASIGLAALEGLAPHEQHAGHGADH